jgi:hypothetical protein
MAPIRPNPVNICFMAFRFFWLVVLKKHILDGIAPEVAVIVKITGYRSRESGMIDFQSALKSMQNLIAPRDYYSFHSRLTSIRK